MDFSFEDHAYQKLLDKIGVTGNAPIIQMKKVVLPLAVFWLPLAILTAIEGTFWNGDIETSFITSFDIQAKFLISLPILILSEKLVSRKLSLIIGQFLSSGIVPKSEYGKFNLIIEKYNNFLRSNWTDIVVYALSFLQVVVIFYYEKTNTDLLSWQVINPTEAFSLTASGWWSILLSWPFVLFLFYRWLLRIIVWGLMLRKVSRLNLTLFPIHPDLIGGLGFLGYAIRYFSPIAFAISASVAGSLADYLITVGSDLSEFQIPLLGYITFITLLFTIPLLSFSWKLNEAKEDATFENDDFSNGIFRELRVVLAKGYDKVTPEDLKRVDFSAVADLSAVMEHAIDMKTIPFEIRDLIPLWVMTALPFLAIVLMEFPFAELFKQVVELII